MHTAAARRIATFLAAAAVLWAYWWTAAPATAQPDIPTGRDAYYNLLVDGWRAGRLNLIVEPHPSLALLGNPYDPVQNRPYRLHDASYYRGRYYLYFGPTPALVLFLPWASLTGTYLETNQGVAVFASASFLAYLAVLASVRRRYFAKAGALAMGVVTLALGIANGIPVLLRRPEMWELPIAAGAAFVALAVGGIWKSVHDRRRCWLWLALASAAYGLALGARPSLLPGALILLVPLFVAMRDRATGGYGLRVTGYGLRFAGYARLALAAAVPIGVIVLGLLAYNWKRFRDPFEFGQRYQLTAVENPDVRHFSASFIPYNFRVYFLATERWQSYFPFVRGIELPPAPPGKLGSENPYGILPNLPITWLAALIPLVVLSSAVDSRARAAIAGIAGLAIANAAVILCFAGACNRYEVDFLPPLLLLSGIGVLFVDDRFHGDALRLWLSRAAWTLLAAVSISMSMLISFEHWGLLRTRAPASYARMARAFNAPVNLLENWRGITHGPVEIRVMLPPFTATRMEPLIVSGPSSFAADYLYVIYEDPGHIRIGLEHTGEGGPASLPIPVDYSREHALVVDAGMLYPPPEHPYYRSLDPATAADVQRNIAVTLDGRRVLSARWKFFDASPLTRWFGSNPYAENIGRAFSGKIMALRTIGPNSAVEAK